MKPTRPSRFRCWTNLAELRDPDTGTDNTRTSPRSLVNLACVKTGLANFTPGWYETGWLDG
jgi:hypothetical protein